MNNAFFHQFTFCSAQVPFDFHACMTLDEQSTLITTYGVFKCCHCYMYCCCCRSYRQCCICFNICLLSLLLSFLLNVCCCSFTVAVDLEVLLVVVTMVLLLMLKLSFYCCCCLLMQCCCCNVAVIFVVVAADNVFCKYFDNDIIVALPLQFYC